ncbi:alpha/beta hydrolase [uncultured Shewanella sp.]|uniref:alpha/beta fold hydrolase n=1 Tax=uncultured Shewanella sp. TaxID=173975 RepID=UPI00263588BE|nr:alpha/beta hydrolase [uncultured Shewanella sp.]
MASVRHHSHFFITNDNVKLHYLDKGEGQPIVMLPSWSLSTDIYQHQITALSKKYRVIALDMRGHGLSEKVDYGYKIYRFAHDLYECLNHLDIQGATLLGHAVGASIILCYWELFGSRHIKKLILVDRAATPIINPAWSSDDIAHFGPTSDTATVQTLCHQIASVGGRQYQQILLNYMLSKNISNTDKQHILDSASGLPNTGAANLFYDNYHQDWRNTLKYISLPTLIIAGSGSPIAVSSQRWMSQQIKHARLRVFAVEEGGKHFPFIENPKKFNHLIDEFLQS